MSKTKVTIKFDDTKNYLDTASYLLDHISDKDGFLNPNKFAFFLVSASALECILNEAIISWAHSTFQLKDHKRMADSFLSMNLRSKLNSAIYLLSSSEYIADNQSKSYLALSELIRLRNEVAHSKSHYSEVEMEIIGDPEFATEDDPAEIRFHQDISKFQKGSLRKSIDECKEILASLNSLYSVVRRDGDGIAFEKSELCLKVSA